MTQLFWSLTLLLLLPISAFSQVQTQIEEASSATKPSPDSGNRDSSTTPRNANGIRFADQYPSVQAAINDFGAPGSCGIVYVPQGTYTANVVLNSSNTCTNPSNMLIIRGAGRRNTILKPASNACVLTIDSTAGPVQGVTIEDLSFDNTSTGFSGSTNNAICIIGNNINDEHLFRRIFVQGGFYNNVSITGRCIWCTFEDDEFDGGTNDSFSVNNAAGSGLVGLLTLERVKIDGGTTAKRCIYMNTSTASNAGIIIRDSTAQNCKNEGANLSNIDGLEIANTDFEANGSAGTYDNLLLAGTFLRGFHIHGSHFLNSTTGNAIEITATLVGGSIDGNLIASGAQNTIRVGSGVTIGQINLGCNYETFTATGHNIVADANGAYHATGNCALAFAQIANNQTGIQAIGVTGVNAIRFVNASPLTVTNFTGADPGQIVQVFNEGSSTVAFSFSNMSGFYTPSGSTLTLAAGQTFTWVYSPYNSRWIAVQNSPFFAPSISTDGQITSTLAAGTAPFSITSTTPVTNLNVANHPSVFFCGRTTTCSSSQATNEKIYFGSVTLKETTSTVGSIPSMRGTEMCMATDQAGAAGGCTIASPTSIRVTGTSGHTYNWIIITN